MKRFTSLAAAVFTAAFLATASSASAQGATWDQTTFLTFSAPVQVPGATLPAGTYTFKYPSDSQTHNIIQVFDKAQKHLYSQFFFVPTMRTEKQQEQANGKPVVIFYETAEKTMPSVEYYFYPTDLRGKKFIYPKDQAMKIAAATHRSVLATDSDIAKGGEAHVFQVNPNGTESAYNDNDNDNQANNNNADQTASNSADVNNNNAPAASASASTSDQNVGNRPAATTGAYDQNQTPRQQASAELPKTASPIQLIGLIGLLSLAGGFGLRSLARDNA